MRTLILAALAATLTPAAAMAQAPKPYTTAETTLGVLVADPAAKAILEKHVPQMVGAADQAGSLTLKALQQYAPDAVTDKILADIDAELAKLPPKK